MAAGVLAGAADEAPAAVAPAWLLGVADGAETASLTPYRNWIDGTRALNVRRLLDSIGISLFLLVLFFLFWGLARNVWVGQRK